MWFWSTVSKADFANTRQGLIFGALDAYLMHAYIYIFFYMYIYIYVYFHL